MQRLGKSLRANPPHRILVVDDDHHRHGYEDGAVGWEALPGQSEFRNTSDGGNPPR
jgi:hypothetical protein